jgi:hypothetical protein
MSPTKEAFRQYGSTGDQTKVEWTTPEFSFSTQQISPTKRNLRKERRISKKAKDYRTKKS